MRVIRMATAVLFGATLGAAGGGLAWGQSNPSANDLIRSLTPTSAGGVNRGIHIVHPQGQGGGAGGMAPQAEALPSANVYVLFATGSAELTPAATRALDTLGTALIDPRLAGGRFRIEGHTDTVGSPETNLALSEARAKAGCGLFGQHLSRRPGQAGSGGSGSERVAGADGAECAGGVESPCGGDQPRRLGNAQN